MISQSLFLDLGVCSAIVQRSRSKEEMLQFIKPYVFVMHRPSRFGFYLSNSLQHIITVSCCQEPAYSVRITCRQLPGGFPPWVMEMILPKGWAVVNSHDEFDTFWLY